jgi:hypothetical protein
MTRCAWVLLASLAWAGPMSAQTVMRPDAPLDSARATVRDALLRLRDSLNTIDGAAARLQRDFRHASGPSLLSRARVMREACARSVRTVPPTRTAVLDAKLLEPRRIKRRSELVGAMDNLRGALARCERDFAAMSRPGQAETVRGYGNDRAVRVQAALRRYENTLRGFLGIMGIRVTPLGGNPRPSAG